MIAQITKKRTQPIYLKKVEEIRPSIEETITESDIKIEETEVIEEEKSIRKNKRIKSEEEYD